MSTTAIRRDVWPAELHIDPDAPDPQHRRLVYPVRVVVTLDEVFVFADGAPPTLQFRDRLQSYSAPIPPQRATKQQLREGLDVRHIATTESGHVLVFTKASGCGCGSRLKVLSLGSLLTLAESSVSPVSLAPAQPDQTANSTPFTAAASSKDR